MRHYLLITANHSKEGKAKYLALLQHSRTHLAESYSYSHLTVVFGVPQGFDRSNFESSFVSGLLTIIDRSYTAGTTLVVTEFAALWVYVDFNSEDEHLDLS